MTMDFKTFTRDDAKSYPLPGGTCWLYPDGPLGNLSCALVEQDGRYPEEGFRQNSVCTEAMFVMDGAFTLTVAGTAHPLKKHDVAYVPLNTPYSIEGKGSVFVFIEPKWDSAQNTPSA